MSKGNFQNLEVKIGKCSNTADHKSFTEFRLKDRAPLYISNSVFRIPSNSTQQLSYASLLISLTKYRAHTRMKCKKEKVEQSGSRLSYKAPPNPPKAAPAGSRPVSKEIRSSSSIMLVILEREQIHLTAFSTEFDTQDP